MIKRTIDTINTELDIDELEGMTVIQMADYARKKRKQKNDMEIDLNRMCGVSTKIIKRSNKRDNNFREKSRNIIESSDISHVDKILNNTGEEILFQYIDYKIPKKI